jgi:exonuclease SbcC
MRPRRLVIEGFAAFRDRAELDFDGVDFFALVGPTGSGKSSVIDAICFALYGNVPRYDNRIVAPVITIGSIEAKVMLEFSIGEERFIATRVARRSSRGTGASTKEARLEHVVGETTEVLAGNADELSARVEKLLGLSYDYFTRCVVLPQGAFARFLHDTAGNRQGLLRSLLDIDIYTRIGRTARQNAENDKGAITMGGQLLEQLSDATPALLAEAEEQVARLEELTVVLRRAEVELAQLKETIDLHRQASRQAGEMVARLGRISLPLAIESAAGEQRSLKAAVAEAEASLEAAVAARQALEGVAQPELAPFEAADRAHKALVGLAGDLVAAGDGLASAIAAVQAAHVAAAAAEDLAGAAADELESARRQHSAAHLASSLVAGEVCPVCLQPVGTLPRHKPAAAIDKAEALVAAADREMKVASQAMTAKASLVAAAEATEKGLRAQQELLLHEVREHLEADVVTEAIAEIKRHQAELESARQAEESTRAAHSELKKRADKAAGALGSAWSSFDDQRDPVIELGPPPAARADVLADWSALMEWAREKLAAQKALAAKSDDAAALAGNERDAQLAQLTGRCEAAGVDLDAVTGMSGIRDHVAKTLASATARQLMVAQDMNKAELLRAQIADLVGRQAVADMLANHLRSTGFERWLVAEALDLLVVTASETLRKLSGGQYSLGHDERNDFVVVDHGNADEQRPARSLSGGETFQASLALALALAEQLSAMTSTGTSRIESIFLDEGFGTLDPDALATVADTIEALGSDERMVGIVTHVRELAERVPVRFEISKDARTSRVEPHFA